MIVVLATSLVFAAPLGASATAGHSKRHMPNLIGRTRAQVYAVMRADDLFFVTKGPGSANATWKDVVAQSPRAGTVVPWHFQAILTTSTQSLHGTRRVPRVLGFSRARTYAAMARAQLFFTTRGSGSSDGKWKVVLHQTPRAGTRVRWHATISLVVSTAVPKVKSKPKPRPRPKRPVHVTTTTRAPVRRRPTPSCVPVTTSTTAPTTTTTTTTTVTTSTVPTSTTTPDGTDTTTTTSPAPTTTTTICKVPVTTTTVKPRKPKRYRIGDATWYSYTPGRCATWYLPRGTRVTVRDLKTGKAIHCIATDREAAHGNRVVDLNERQFAQLAPLAQGVVVVKVSW